MSVAVIIFRMAAVKERKTVADYINERDQADFVNMRDQADFIRERNQACDNKESAYTQMQNHYMSVSREPDSFLASSVQETILVQNRMQSLYAYLHLSPEPETIMDDEVLPPIRDFEGEEMVGLIGEDEKKEKVSSWEEEFGDELVGLPVLEEEEEFDPVGDLAYLEKLLEGKPTMEIKNSPKEDEHVSEKFDSRPVEESDVGLPLRPRTREKAKKRKKAPGYQDRSPHYMSQIRFGPGKFKNRWSDSFPFFITYYNSTNQFLIAYIIRVELNRLDRVPVKEKPPD